MIAAVVNTSKVENIIVLDSTAAIPAIKAAFNYEYIIPVDESVQVGDTYDPQAGIFMRDGVRIYPEISDKEKISALETENVELNAQITQLENALCEMDEANAERMAAIEDALCEIDAGGTTV